VLSVLLAAEKLVGLNHTELSFIIGDMVNYLLTYRDLDLEIQKVL